MENTIIEDAKNLFTALDREEIIKSNTLQEIHKNLIVKKNRLEQLISRSELLKMTSEVIQIIIDRVSVDNIRKIENLVNHALSSIFYDLSLEFRIDQKVKRNLLVYNPVILENGNEGGINSYGGGVVSTISFVLKTLFNLLSKSYPLLVFDESLGFLADKYIPYASKFIKELTKEFNIPIMLVTHNQLFVQEADHILNVDKVGTFSTIKVG